MPQSATGWACAVCGRTVDIAEPFTWRCPGSTDIDRHHALQLVQPEVPFLAADGTNPFLRFRPFLAWDGFAAALGLDAQARTQLVAELDDCVAAVDGHGFLVSPFMRSDALSDALGFNAAGGVWVKNDTGNVGGSHKARHLFTILLHLVAAERAGRAPWTSPASRPTLAIASCGNAAIAASTLAAAVEWPIRVFVPTTASASVVARLNELNANVVECPRLPSDPPGDPCVHRFREAVAAGAIPFSVQGTENAWCLDGGRTIGWEMGAQLADEALHRVFVQVGGGAFAASVSAGLRMAGVSARLHAVQTDSCAPLERAWQRALSLGGVSAAASHWSDCMWPWESVGASAADGILDDETYDWLPVLAGMAASNGSPVVASEAHVVAANDLGCRTTGIDASPTGTSGLAGLLALRDDVAPHERVAVIFSGIRR